MIRKWNSVVSPDDVVYHLGDLTLGDFEKAQHYLNRLNGQIIKVLSNIRHHDKQWLSSARLELDGDYTVSTKMGFLELLSPIYLIPPHTSPKLTVPIVLCHFPIQIWEHKHHSAWHLFGHSHTMRWGNGLAYNVGVDLNDFMPVSLKAITEYMEDRLEYIGKEEAGILN